MTGRPSSALALAVLLFLAGFSGPLVSKEVGDDLCKTLEGNRIGSPPCVVDRSEKAGMSAVDERRLIRWETVQRTPVVTAIALAWSFEDQQRHIQSGSCLSCVAEQVVRTWAPSDAIFISQHRLGVGGTALFAYKSESLREMLENRHGAEEIFVVIVLDAENNRLDAPIVAPGFLGQNDLGSAQFSVALIAGHPWRGKKP